MTGESSLKIDTPLIVVVGSTASGKSALGVKLSEVLNGEVVNLDSVQVFKRLDIGSGKITKEEMAGIPHHLIDIAQPNEQLNVGRIMELADQAILEIASRGKRPIVVAGTTLYLKCLLNGLVDIPGEDAEFRKSLSDVTTVELFNKLRELDPVRSTQLSQSDRVRIIRSLEIINSTGNLHSNLIAEHQHQEQRYRAIILNLCWPREKLYERIDSRCKNMIDGGLLNETADVLREYGKVGSFNALGYAQSLSVLEGVLDKNNLLTEMQTKTRQFAKRQLSFWRNQPESLKWSVLPESGEGVLLKSQDKPLKKGAELRDLYVMNHSFNEIVQKLRAGPIRPKGTVELWNIGAEMLMGSLQSP